MTPTGRRIGFQPVGGRQAGSLSYGPTLSRRIFRAPSDFPALLHSHRFPDFPRPPVQKYHPFNILLQKSRAGRLRHGTCLRREEKRAWRPKRRHAPKITVPTFGARVSPGAPAPSRPPQRTCRPAVEGSEGCEVPAWPRTSPFRPLRPAAAVPSPGPTHASFYNTSERRFASPVAFRESVRHGRSGRISAGRAPRPHHRRQPRPGPGDCPCLRGGWRRPHPGRPRRRQFTSGGGRADSPRAQRAHHRRRPVRPQRRPTDVCDCAARTRAGRCAGEQRRRPAGKSSPWRKPRWRRGGGSSISI